MTGYVNAQKKNATSKLDPATNIKNIITIHERKENLIHF